MQRLIILVWLIASYSSSAQEIIFPGLKGDSLVKEIIKYYTPSKVFEYNQARKILYTKVFQNKDSLECYYSGYKIPVSSAVDILAWTAKYGIQTEHLYPQSMGASIMPAKADLHHLVPVKSTINILRKNAPFQDIDDTKTQYWMINDKVVLVPDKNSINHYSEYRSGSFEPKEIVKGDVARSIFYFYTFYFKLANKKNATYFKGMLTDLCKWHRLDKVDSTEYKKTMAIAKVQGNINPFVLDASLAERCYCASIPNTILKVFNMDIYPNPTSGLIYILIPDYQGQIILIIKGENGKVNSTNYLMYTGLFTWRLTPGIYDIEVKLESGDVLGRKVLVR